MKIRKLTLTIIVLATVGILAGARRLYTPITAQQQPLAAITGTTNRAQISSSAAVRPTETTVAVSHDPEVANLRKQLEKEQQRNLRQAKEIDYLKDLLERYIETDALSCDCDDEEGALTEEKLAELNAADEERLLELENAMMSEPRDVESSEAMNAYIDELLDSHALPDTSITESSCHEDVCRITLAHQSKEAADQVTDFAPALLEISYHNGIEQFDNGDGTYSTVLYLSKAQIY